MPIRPATTADVTALAALLRESPTAAQWSTAQLAELIAGSAQARLCLVVEEDEALRGFLVAHEIGAEWELENIVVTESVRRQGLGAQLVGALLKTARARRASSIFLEVRYSNHGARRLYEKCGFHVAGHRPRYYHDPVEDAVLYRLDLS